MSDTRPRAGQRQQANIAVGATSAPQQPTPGRVTRPRGRAGQQRYAALVELAPDAMVLVNADGHIALVNRQTEVLFGYAREELLGQSVEVLIPERLHAAHAHHRAGYAAAPRTRPMGVGLQLAGRRRDGSEFSVEVSLSPLDEAGEHFVIASIRDITELRRVQAAQQEAEQANQALQQLQALTDTALAHLSLDDLLPPLVERVHEAMAVDDVSILLLNAEEQTLVVRATLALEEAVAEQVRVPVGQGLAGTIAATRAPLVVDDLATFPVMHSFLREHLRSAVGVPLLLGTRVLGVLHVGTTEPHHFTERDVQLLQRAADRVAVAVERARLYEGAQVAYAAEQQARQEAEAALARARSSERRFQRLMEANVIGLFIVEGTRLIEANDAFLNLVGYTRADLMAGQLRWPDLTPPEYLAVSWRAEEEVIATGACAPFEKEYIRKDGSRVPMLLGSVLLDRDPTRFVTFVVDLSERKRLEEEREAALRHSEEWFRSMANTAPVLLWVAGTNGLVTFVNASWLRFTGRQMEQEVGNGWAEGVHPDDYQHCMETYLTAFQARQSFTMVYRLRRADGEYRWVLDTGVPRFAHDGTFEGYIGSAIDVTEREQLKQERELAQTRELAAREVAQQLDQFFSAAAHDIRTPVTVVVTSVQLALRRFDQLEAGAATGRGDLNELLKALRASLVAADASTDRLARMVKLLFDVVRARSGALELQLIPCDLAAVVRDQIAAQRVATPDRTISLLVPDQPVPVVADADRLGQVLTNYLTNALKYSAEDTSVEVRLETTEGLAVVSVRDQGPGLPPEEQSRVWEMFHRVPGVEALSQVSGSIESLGLGLHICQRIVEAHPNGHVGVESAVGQGSTFWFTLPLAPSAADADGGVTLPTAASPC